MTTKTEIREARLRALRHLGRSEKEALACLAKEDGTEPAQLELTETSQRTMVVQMTRKEIGKFCLLTNLLGQTELEAWQEIQHERSKTSPGASKPVSPAAGGPRKFKPFRSGVNRS